MSEIDNKDAVLILTDDRYTPASKTSRFIMQALRRLGIRAWVRDTSDVRYLFKTLEAKNLEKHLGASGMIHVDRFKSFVDLAGVQSILSLDLHWLFTPEPFCSNDKIKKIVSLWFDDLRTACTSQDAIKPTDRSFQETIGHQKVHHCFYGQAQMDEGKLLGITNTHFSQLAAPLEFAQRETDDLRHPKKLAFIGNPGIPTPPSEKILNLLNNKASLKELRKASAMDLLQNPSMDHFRKLHTNIPKIIEQAIEQKLHEPYTSALQLLLKQEKNFPGAFDALNKSGNVLEAAILIRLVNRYDRPALVHRLYQHGFVRVFSAEDEWKPYGIEAKPLIRFHDLCRVYRAHIAHLNGANSARDATANEKLFEIAACGRASLNLTSPDILKAFDSPTEIIACDTLEELESKAHDLLAQPEQLLEIGNNARQRVIREHTWDKRIKTLFKSLP
ncbi:MAG: glycosyltransferase [Verrucomicrobiota bacterium]